MADETKDPLRRDLEALAARWERFVSAFSDSKVEKTLQGCAADLRAALSAPAPEPKGWEEIEQLVWVVFDAAEFFGGRGGDGMSAEKAARAVHALLRALRASVSGPTAPRCATCRDTGERVEDPQAGGVVYCECPIGEALGAAWMGTGHEEETVEAVRKMLAFLVGTPSAPGASAGGEAGEALLAGYASKGGDTVHALDPARKYRALCGCEVSAIGAPFDAASSFACQRCKRAPRSEEGKP